MSRTDPMAFADLVILFHSMMKAIITFQSQNYIVNAPEFVIKYNLSIVSSGHSSFCYILYIQLDVRYDYIYLSPYISRYFLSHNAARLMQVENSDKHHLIVSSISSPSIFTRLELIHVTALLTEISVIMPFSLFTDTENLFTP